MSGTDKQQRLERVHELRTLCEYGDLCDFIGTSDEVRLAQFVAQHTVFHARDFLDADMNRRYGMLLDAADSNNRTQGDHDDVESSSGLEVVPPKPTVMLSPMQLAKIYDRDWRVVKKELAGKIEEVTTKFYRVPVEVLPFEWQKKVGGK